MKLIALDVGTKRIGVAKADSTVRVAVPYSAVEVDGNEFNKIASLARAWDVNNFVLGLPRNSQGEETQQSRYVRKFAKVLKEAIPDAKICFQDESLTSVEAEKRLKNRKKGYKKGDIDSEAAAIILQDFIEEKTGKNTSRAAAVRSRSIKGSKAKPHRFAAVLVTLLILLVLAGGGAFAFYSYNLRPVSEVDCNSAEAEECDDTLFAVETGSSVSDIAAELEEAGLIRNSLVFQVYFRLNSGGETLKAGEHALNKSMSVAEIVDSLLHGDNSNTFTFTVLPGATVQDVRNDLIAVGYDEASVDAALAADYRGEDYGWIFEGRPEDSTSLEGYLYGETYEFYVNDTAEAIVGQLLQGMADTLKEYDFKAGFEAHGLNLYQGITLASIVQKEANNATDMARVAKIFYNRLAAEMPLGSDVTVAYAVNLADPNGEQFSDNAAAIEIDSPYNTRKNPGLPYGPVSNPGIDALTSVATPDEAMADMLFFLTGDDGMMYYSSTEAEHNQNIIDHCQVLCNAPLHN